MYNNHQYFISSQLMSKENKMAAPNSNSVFNIMRPFPVVKQSKQYERLYNPKSSMKGQSKILQNTNSKMIRNWNKRIKRSWKRLKKMNSKPFLQNSKLFSKTSKKVTTREVVELASISTYYYAKRFKISEKDEINLQCKKSAIQDSVVTESTQES